MAEQRAKPEFGSISAEVDPGRNPHLRLLDRRAIRLAERAADRDDAIRRCGEVLVELGAVTPAYAESMVERERSVSTYMGEGVAIPHGTLAGKDAVRRDALAVLKFPDGVDWDGNPVTIAVAIAVRGDGHLALLAELAQVLLDPDRARGLREADDPDEVLRLLSPVQEEQES
jgi:PTS system mannitol-specific IIA component